MLSVKMGQSKRRKFLKQSLVLGSTLAMPNMIFSMPKLADHKYRMSLNPGAIGVNLPFDQVIELAIKYGFEAVCPQISEIRKYSASKKSALLAQMKSAGMTWDSANLPVQFRNSEEEFRKGMNELAANAELLQQLGATRMNTWIMPTSNTFTYRENFDLHAKRLREAAKVLAPYGVRLGLEYVGPKTLMAHYQYAFIHTMRELQELLAEIDMSNVGIQLDAFHWYCAKESVEDITKLDPSQIITVDLNDAKAGRTADEQLDGERELPGDSGSIDLNAFLKALQQIGYDGPIRAEPFNQVVNDMEPEAAIAATFKAMERSFNNAN